LLSEAEGSNGPSGLNGYANSWAYWYGPNFYSGIAGEIKSQISDEEAKRTAAEMKVAIPEKTVVQTANIVMKTGPIVFSPADPKLNRGPRVSIERVNANFSAKIGFSVLEITVWTPVDNMKTKVADKIITKDKILWTGKIVVHDNKAVISGKLSEKLFQDATKSNFSIVNKDLEIELPANVDVEKIAVSVRGDSGDQTIVEGNQIANFN
jgi:hypothetical protein